MRTAQGQSAEAAAPAGKIEAGIQRAPKNQRAAEARQQQAGQLVRLKVTHGKVVGSGYDHDQGAALPGDVITVGAAEAKRLIEQKVAVRADDEI